MKSEAGLLLLLATLILLILPTTTSQTTHPFIIYRGNMTWSPGSLNTMIGTYHIAHKWQQHDKPYGDWLQIIENYGQFKQENGLSHDPVWNKLLFNEWNIDGDLTSYYQTESVAYFDPSLENPLVVLKPQQRFKMSQQMGRDKAVITPHDSDVPSKPRLYGLKMQIGDQYKFEGEASTIKDMLPFVINSNDQQTSTKTNYFVYGSLKENQNRKLSKQTEIISKIWQSYKTSKGNKAFMKFSQHSFNKDIRMSQISGFMTIPTSEKQIPEAEWRYAYAESNLGNIDNKKQSLVVYFKEVSYGSNQKGTLFDLSDVIFRIEKNSQLEYPQVLKISLGEENQFQVTPRKLLEEQGGFYLHKSPLPESLSFKATVFFASEKPLSIAYLQNQHNIKVVNKLISTNLINNFKQHAPNEYENFLDIDLFATVNNKPFTGEKVVQIETQYDVRHQKGIKENFQKVIQKQLQGLEGSQKEIKRNQLIEQVFLNTEYYDLITSSFSEVEPHLLTQNDLIIAYKSKDSSQVFYLEMSSPESSNTFINKTHQKVFFQDGFGTLRVKLNQDLTNNNNPRHPVKESLAIIGRIKEVGCLQAQKDNDFAGIFYQNRIQGTRMMRVDWKNEVGPKLRMNALLFPAMQGILDLYSFQNISIDSMKRAFDVEDINNIRYMPASRQLSPTEHRRIRRWLYEPYYHIKGCDSTCRFLEKEKYRKSEQFKTFESRKQQLIKNLKQAWQIELMTIPLYLSAMYTIQNKNSYNLLRSIATDEMKHLYIVSNVLNALGQRPPFKDPNYIPYYPNTFPIVFKAKDQYLKNLLKFDIQPCSGIQTLKFMIVQLPTESSNLKVSFEGIQSQDKQKKISQVGQILGKVNQEKESEESEFLGIGDAYVHIIDELWALYDMNPNQIFTGDPQMQFTYFALDGMFEVFDMRTALDQLRLIVKDGQGASLFYPTGEANKQSHFLKFMQIYTGCRINDIKLRDIPGHQSQFVIYFEEFDLESESGKKWTKQTDKEVEQKMERDLKRQKTGGGQYINVYSRKAFLNLYEKILDEMNDIFNLKPSTFQQIIGTDKFSSAEFKRYRFKKMQDSISTMRRMTLVSDSFIRPASLETANSRDVFQNHTSSSPPFNLPGRGEEKVEQL